MRKSLLFVFSVIFLFMAYAFTNIQEEKEIEGKLEITVDYERQEGRGSNQYAVWIEDSNGKLVKTLYVTNFTAKGGYERRPDCTPTWVKKANASSLKESEIDAFSGATPQTGKHVYVWDGKDTNNREVSSGTYTFVVEATYLGSNIVVFKGEFETGDEKVSITPIPEFNSDEQQNRTMIQEVSAQYIP